MSSKIPARRLKPKLNYKSIEPLVLEVKLENKNKTEITLNIQGTLLQDQRSVAKQLANYFATVGESSFDNCPAMNLTPEECDRHPSVPAIHSRWNSNSFIFRNITKEETFLSLKDFNTNKAIGFDMIPSHALKIAAQELADPLTTIVNRVQQ